MTWRGSQEMLPDDSPGGRSTRKDTTRWCLGHEGREHDWQVVDYWELRFHERFIPRGSLAYAWLIEYCIVCQKQGKHIGDLTYDHP